ncbi:MAG: hypothetical protein IJX85_10145 [Lachnospiraceae bacterium]|nr:hypothetical protein [Lachnospiraceae bacterium]
MLNEKLIFTRLTTGIPADCPYLRAVKLKDKNKPSIIGLSYIFTIMARGFLFNNPKINKICNGEENDNSITHNKIQLCIYLLNLWCGFSQCKDAENNLILPNFQTDDNTKDIANSIENYVKENKVLDGFLKKWFDSHNELDNLKNAIYSIKEQGDSNANNATNAKTTINTSINYNNYNPSNPYEMDYDNQLSFPKVISAAIDLGPLKEYFLICKNKLFAEENKEINVKYKPSGPSTHYADLAKKTAYENEYSKFVAYIALNKRLSTETLSEKSIYLQGYEFYVWCQERIKKRHELLKLFWYRQSKDNYLPIAYPIDDTRVELNEKWYNEFFPMVISSDEYKRLINNNTSVTDKKKIVPYYNKGYFAYTESENLNTPLHEISNQPN